MKEKVRKAGIFLWIFAQMRVGGGVPEAILAHF
jgi:hypothetical protein